MSPSGQGAVESIAALIDRYAMGSELLVYATQQLTTEQERARPGPGSWSIAELVGHLLDSDLVYADRIKRVIAEENPTLQAFDENAWIERLGGAETPVEEAVNLFMANRRYLTRILRRLPESDFARTGTHTANGRMSLAALVTTITGHVDHHLKFLYGKRGHLGASLYPRFTRD